MRLNLQRKRLLLRFRSSRSLRLRHRKFLLRLLHLLRMPSLLQLLRSLNRKHLHKQYRKNPLRQIKELLI